MPTLNINDFSCIQEASFTLASVNVIIGPQGSGKSVTTKLFYFFSDIMTSFITACERGESFDQYSRLISKQFAIWFPPSAWGQERFIINYSAGPFSARVLRKRSKGQMTDDVSVTFSPWFREHYHFSLDLFNKSSSSEDELLLDVGSPVRDPLDRMWKLRDEVTLRTSRALDADYLSRQTFIPAGRAFFTSIGRLVAGLEHAGSLDPVTIKFARLFAQLRDRGSSRYLRARNSTEELASRRQLFMEKLFGGEIKFENESEYVEAIDGRKIPFSSLSSGQQELLPMWSLIDYFTDMDFLRLRTRHASARRRGRDQELLYIEEPEAHLFPSAQGLLMEFLIGSIIGARTGRSLIITTHSPYIMSKLNVFLKAGQLSRRKKRNTDINEIVPRDCWLAPSQLSAYAIEGRKLKRLYDDDGLIDGTYLDSVSEDISEEFSSLLQIEVEMMNDR